VGRQLGEYVLRQRIGSGGMGVVYSGEHTSIGRKAAIKLIREEHAQSPHARDLLTEARAASAIRHHGIIDVYGFGHQPGVGQYLVMEYLEGQPLNELIRDQGALPPARALPILCEVLDALSAAHAMGVIHRDLKPSNIFVVRQSNGAEYIKVLDFGLAKRTTTPDATSAQTHSNLIIGTPQYMAPEQALCEAVGPQTDLYAVGVIAFELLTGQRPFPGRSHMEVVAHHLKSPPPAPSSLVPQPPELDALVLRLLIKEPKQRPASASEVARELRALIQPSDGAPVLVPRTISRPLPTVRPADSAPLNAPTATLSPTPSTPRPALEARAEPPARGSRWKWAAMAAGGTLALALGAGLVVSREPAPSVSAEPPPSLAPVASTSTPPAPAPQPVATAPEPEPQSPPAPAPALAESPKPAKKKPSKPLVQPTSAPAKQPAPAAQPPPLAAAQPPAPVTQQPAPAAQPAPERAATGTLHLMVRGAWVDVWIDGQKLGRVPPQNRYPMTAGEHTLELRNPNVPTYRQEILIPANGTLPHTVDFTTTAQTASSPPP
jgi:serine/threonine-protein kinase